MADPVLQMADLLARCEAGRSYQCLHSISSVNWKQRFDCVYLSEMIYKTLLRSEPGEEKHLCSYLRSFSPFFLCVRVGVREQNVAWLESGTEGTAGSRACALREGFGGSLCQSCSSHPRQLLCGVSAHLGALADNRQWAKPARWYRKLQHAQQRGLK